ncbi:MAG: aminodeoxychorismate lyase [Actinomycetota bacterium]|nr:aminodeoxychorismate lyase [Actinomycetota bacterium]
MASVGDFVVTLDGEVVAADHPVACGDDPLFGRGDGVFETVLIRGGRARLLGEHLDRMARSATNVGLPPPERTRWQAAALTAAAECSGDEAVLRLVFGRRSDGGATGFLTVSTLPARVPAARRDGVSAMTLDRGVSGYDLRTAPWSIAATKSLSYALNAAALHHARNLGIDDVVLLSTDGLILEGPRSNVVVVDEQGALVTPPASLPILAGTTVKAVFETARSQGRHCREAPLRVADLHTAQGVWLLSSVTLAARVHTLDGVPLAVDPGVLHMASLVAAAIGGP